MQGVFLSTDDGQKKDDRQKNDDGQRKKSDEQKRTRDDEWLELDSNNSSSELGAEFTINRLNAISNVPWDEHLQPSNDRDTEKRMRQHREREIKYNTLDVNRKLRKPKVIPYPESPDMVFPGTPYFRMAVDGVYKYIFVVDLDDVTTRQNHAGWNGQIRIQTVAYWIEPFFIYRAEDQVSIRKKNWSEIYSISVLGNQLFPSKFDFNSTPGRVAALILAAATQMARVAAAPPLPVGVAPAPAAIAAAMARIPAPVIVTGCANDSYYVPGISNTNPTAPEVIDPLFCGPFNTRFPAQIPVPFPAGGAIPFPVRIRPYPYKQPSPAFPQQPDPPTVRMPAARPGVPAPPIPLPAQNLLVALPPSYTGTTGIDWILTDPNNLEIGTRVLREACEQAEEMDYNFALTMQGLKGVSLHAVWNCTDPEYDSTDRSTVMEQFVKAFMEKFYSQVSVTGPAEVEDIVHEALHMHEDFCRGWISMHHRTLSPEITAASEALVGMFFEDLKGCFPVNVSFTRVHMARYLRRHMEFCGEFAHCLYHYMTSIEQMRGNRNPSYRAMQSERVANITAMKKMASMLNEKFGKILSELKPLTQLDLMFDKKFIDWHYIAAQLPAHHKQFEGYLNSFSLFRTRIGGRGNNFPPWQQMRART